MNNSCSDLWQYWKAEGQNGSREAFFFKDWVGNGFWLNSGSLGRPYEHKEKIRRKCERHSFEWEIKVRFIAQIIAGALGKNQPTRVMWTEPCETSLTPLFKRKTIWTYQTCPGVVPMVKILVPVIKVFFSLASPPHRQVIVSAWWDWILPFVLRDLYFCLKMLIGMAKLIPKQSLCVQAPEIVEKAALLLLGGVLNCLLIM